MCRFGQINIVAGKKQYLFDEDGRRYLDAFGGIATVCCGHCHPDVVSAIVDQMNRIQHSTVLYLNHSIADFAQALAEKMPGDLKVWESLTFVVSSLFESNRSLFLKKKKISKCVKLKKNHLKYVYICRWFSSRTRGRKRTSWP